jgi:hypothetical protein
VHVRLLRGSAGEGGHGGGHGLMRDGGAGQGKLLACTFHPEISGDVRVHQYFVDLVRSDPRPYAP